MCEGVVGRLNVEGDHDIVVGEVVGGDVRKPGKAADSLTLGNYSASQVRCT